RGAPRHALRGPAGAEDDGPRGPEEVAPRPHRALRAPRGGHGAPGLLPVSPEPLQGGDLDLAGGLLLLIERALERLAPGEHLSVISHEPSVEHDLPAWCRTAGHEYLTFQTRGGRTRHEIRKGPVERLNAARKPDWAVRAPRRGGEIELRDL